MGAWVGQDTDIYSGPASTSWGTVSTGLSGVNFVLLACRHTQASNRLSVRRKGASRPNDCFGDSSSHGFNYTYWAAGNYYYLIAGVTDSSGDLEVKSNMASGTLTVRMLGSCELSHPGPSVLSSDHTFPAGSWESYDISSVCGASRGLAFMNYGWVSGSVTGALGIKEPSDARTSEYNSNTYDGGSSGVVAGSGTNGILLCSPTDASGYLKHGQPAGSALHARILCEGVEVDNYVHVDAQVLDDVRSDAVWEDLDISAHMASPQRALCVFLVERGTGGGSQTIYLSMRRNGETRSFPYSYGIAGHKFGGSTLASVLLMETDSSGIIETYSNYAVGPTEKLSITLLGYIASVTGAPEVVSATYVSPHCLCVQFDQPLRNDSALRTPANYVLSGGTGAVVSAVKTPLAQAQEYTGGSPNGGKPSRVYLLTDEDLYATGDDTVTVSSVVNYYDGTPVSSSANSAIASLIQTVEPTLWTADSLGRREVIREFGRVGKVRF